MHDLDDGYLTKVALMMVNEAASVMGLPVIGIAGVADS